MPMDVIDSMIPIMWSRAPWGQARIGIEREYVRSQAASDADVGGCSKPEIPLCRDQLDSGKLLPHHLDCSIGGSVVDNPDACPVVRRMCSKRRSDMRGEVPVIGMRR